MGIEAITDRILAEANDDARRTAERSGEEERETLERARRLAEQKKSAFSQKAGAEVENVKKRKDSVAQLEARKMKLAARQEAIADCFAEAVRRLAELPEEEYIELLAKAIRDLPAAGGELLLNPRDRERIGEKLLARDGGTAKGGRLTLSQDTIRAAGGFVLRSGTVEINSTLEVMVEAVRGQATPAVIRSLFGEQG